MIVFDSKDPSEEITLAFDYSARGNSASNASISVRLIKGIDPNPSLILSASPQYDGAVVLQKIKGGVRGCWYQFSVYADVGNDKLLIEAVLPVGGSSCDYDICE